MDLMMRRRLMMQKVQGGDDWQLIHSFTPSSDIFSGQYWDDDILLPDTEPMYFQANGDSRCEQGIYGKYMTESDFKFHANDVAKQNWGNEWRVWVKVDLFKASQDNWLEGYFLDFGSVRGTNYGTNAFGFGTNPNRAVVFNIKLNGNNTPPGGNTLQIPSCTADNPIAEITMTVYTDGQNTGVRVSVINGASQYDKDWGAYLVGHIGSLPFDNADWHLNYGVTGGYQARTDQYGLKIWRKI